MVILFFPNCFEPKRFGAERKLELFPKEIHEVGRADARVRGCDFDLKEIVFVKVPSFDSLFGQGFDNDVVILIQPHLNPVGEFEWYAGDLVESDVGIVESGLAILFFCGPPTNHRCPP